MKITEENKAQILCTLYNKSKVQGMGFLQAKPGEMTLEEAQKIIQEIENKKGRLYFDYLYGKVMKIDLDAKELNTFLYNRDNGDGAAEIALKEAGVF